MSKLRSVLYLAALSLFIVGCATQSKTTPTAAPAAPPPPAPATQPTASAPRTVQPQSANPDRALQRITIAAVGDMMLGTDYPQNRLPDDDAVGFLRAVTPILATADLAFGNHEGVLADGGEAAKKCSNPSACYLFRSPARYVKHYTAAGFDLLSLANNHARDFGEAGRLTSMQTLAAAGIYHSGLEGDFATLSVNGLKIAFLAYAVTQNSNLLHDYELARSTVQTFAEDNDVVIVSFHGGAEGRDVTRLPFTEEEYFGEPRGDVVKFSRMMVAAGADLVLGHGPHVVRAMENYNNRLIAYSLGNFATYYGISVAGLKGIAPLLVVTLDGNGKFMGGKIHSTVQLRPNGPSIDPEKQALQLIETLSTDDFGTPGIRFEADGSIFPAPRQFEKSLLREY